MGALIEARPVMAKGTSPVEQVRLTKETVQDVDRVSEQVRKERIQAQGDVDLTVADVSQIPPKW